MHSLEDVEFGDKLETIRSWAFESTALRIAKLPKCRVIGECDQLMDVELSKDLETIEFAAFCDCPRLRRIFIPLKDNLLDNYQALELMQSALLRG